MRVEEIIEFVKQQTIPLSPRGPYGERYRLSAILTDGTNLPCVVVESSSQRVDLAIRRFQGSLNEKHPTMDYGSIVKSFVTKGNSVNDYDIKEVSVSPFAIPLERMMEIKGETSMGWTEFHAIMKDGIEFCFGTNFYMEFFDMPPGYVATDIAKIVPAQRGVRRHQELIYRERPFFTCYIEGI